jgi:vitamin B12 transporter
VNFSNCRSAARALARLSFTILLPLLLSLYCAPAGAQITANPANATTLPDIVVTATGNATPAAEIGSSVTVVTADQIAAQQRNTVNDVLNNVPGLNIVQSGGPGSQTSVFMRGTDSNHVKVLIDGIDVSDPSNPNGSFDFGQLLTGDIARIEVLRGPQSGLYGSDAIGGVISITTKAGSGPPKVTGSIEGGSFGTNNEKLGLSGSTGIFSYSLNIDHLRSVDTPVVPAYLMPPSQKAADQFYDNYTVSARLGADLTDTLAVNSVLRYTDSTLLFNSDLSGACFCLADASRSEQDDRQFYTRDEIVWHSLDNRFRTTLGVAYADILTYEEEPPADFTPPSTFIGQRLTFDLKQDIVVLPGEELILGAQDQNDSLTTTGEYFTQQDRAVYGELESSLFNHFFVASNIRYDEYSDFGSAFTYRIAPAYIFPETGTKIKGSYGTGFKAPTLSQLFQDFPAFDFFANPNLKPEESTGYDVGFEQPFFNDRVRVGSTYFHNNITNLITDNATFTTNVNIGRAVTYAAESFASYKVDDRLNFRVDYTYTMAQDLDTGEELPRRPKNKVTFQTNWTPMDKLRLSATILYVSPWTDINPETFAPAIAKAYTTVNIAATYDINTQVSVFAHIDNLFNQQYQDPLGFLHPGLGAYAGVRVASF